MRRDLWMILILGCLLILLLEAPAALSSVSADLDGPYSGEVHAAERTTEAASRPVLQGRIEKSELAGRDGLGT